MRPRANKNYHAAIVSYFGRSEVHKCRRCKRLLPADQFKPVLDQRFDRRLSRLDGMAHLLHPYCKVCLSQLDGKWVKHPLYSPKVDRFLIGMYRSQKAAATTRGIPWLLTKEAVRSMYFLQEGRCAVSGIKMLPERGVGCKNNIAPSIDRIDSLGPYDLKNTHLVCAVVNLMKLDLPLNRFVDYCKAVAANANRREVDLMECIEATYDSEVGKTPEESSGNP